MGRIGGGWSLLYTFDGYEQLTSCRRVLSADLEARRAQNLKPAALGVSASQTPLSGLLRAELCDPGSLAEGGCGAEERLVFGGGVGPAGVGIGETT